jgi:hypothetical protein
MFGTTGEGKDVRGGGTNGMVPADLSLGSRAVQGPVGGSRPES